VPQHLGRILAVDRQQPRQEYAAQAATARKTLRRLSSLRKDMPRGRPFSLRAVLCARQ